MVMTLTRAGGGKSERMDVLPFSGFYLVKADTALEYKRSIFRRTGPLVLVSDMDQALDAQLIAGSLSMLSG